jgi:hypothetical protein
MNAKARERGGPGPIGDAAPWGEKYILLNYGRLLNVLMFIAVF